jgi:hypothetical protein
MTNTTYTFSQVGRCGGYCQFGQDFDGLNEVFLQDAIDDYGSLTLDVVSDDGHHARFDLRNDLTLPDYVPQELREFWSDTAMLRDEAGLAFNIALHTFKL